VQLTEVGTCLVNGGQFVAVAAGSNVLAFSLR
jgi:hypothetical protein